MCFHWFNLTLKANIIFPTVEPLAVDEPSLDSGYNAVDGFQLVCICFIEQILSFLTLELFFLLVNVVIGNIVPFQESSTFLLANLTHLFAWYFYDGRYHLPTSLKYVSTLHSCPRACQSVAALPCARSASAWLCCRSCTHACCAVLLASCTHALIACYA